MLLNDSVVCNLNAKNYFRIIYWIIILVYLIGFNTGYIVLCDNMVANDIGG